MHRQATFICRSLASLLLSSTMAVFAVDVAKLPTLSNGDISINNDLDIDVTIEATPQGCPMQRLTVRSRSSLVVGCAKAQMVKVNIRWKLPDGRLMPNEQDLPVDAHYIFTWSEETKSYTRLSPVFDSQGRMSR